MDGKYYIKLQMLIFECETLEQTNKIREILNNLNQDDADVKSLQKMLNHLELKLEQ